MDRFNSSGRKLGGDHVSVLSIDSPGGNGLFSLRQLTPVNYVGGTATEGLSLHGFDVEVIDDRKLRFWMINHRPPTYRDNGGRTTLNAYQHGANSTVELFDVIRGGDEMQHVRTIADGAIDTPNNLAATGNGGILITNDHSAKGNLQHRPRNQATFTELKLCAFDTVGLVSAPQELPRKLYLHLELINQCSAANLTHSSVAAPSLIAIPLPVTSLVSQVSITLTEL